MSIIYSKNTWATGNVITATKLNNIESGIEGLSNNVLDILQDLSNLKAYQEVDSRVTNKTGIFYDLFNSTNTYSSGTLDTTKTYTTSAYSAGATSIVVNSATGLSIGMQVTIFDDTNWEHITITNIAGTTLTVSALVGAYKIYATVCRSSVNISGSKMNFSAGWSYDDVTKFTDESTKTWTSNGDVQTSTSQKKFGTASGLFDGTGDYIDTPDHADFNFGSGNFTIDFWLRRSATVGTTQYICGQIDSAGDAATCSFRVFFTSANKIRGHMYSSDTPYQVESTTVITDTNWHHIAMVRDGNTIRLFIDGTQESTVDVTGLTMDNSTNKLAIGRQGESDASYWSGNLDEFRISNSARWTSGFTPPSSAYTSDGNTKVLLHMNTEQSTTALTKDVARYNITPNDTTTDEIVTWVNKERETPDANFTVDGYVSIVDTSANESYSAMTKTTTNVTANLAEEQFTMTPTTANEKVTLRLDLERSSTSITSAVTKLLGAVG